MHSLNNSLPSFTTFQPTYTFNPFETYTTQPQDLLFYPQIQPSFPLKSSTLLHKRVNPHEYPDVLMKKTKLNTQISPLDFLPQNAIGASQGGLQAIGHPIDQDSLRNLYLLNENVRGKLEMPYQQEIKFSSLEPSIIDNNILAQSINSYTQGISMYNDSISYNPYIQPNNQPLQVIAVPIVVNMQNEPTFLPDQASLVPGLNYIDPQGMQFINPMINIEQNPGLLYPVQTTISPKYQLTSLDGNTFYREVSIPELSMEPISIPNNNLKGALELDYLLQTNNFNTSDTSPENKQKLNFSITNRSSPKPKILNQASHQNSQESKPKKILLHAKPEKAEQTLQSQVQKLLNNQESQNQSKEPSTDTDSLIIPSPKAPIEVQKIKENAESFSIKGIDIKEDSTTPKKVQLKRTYRKASGVQSPTYAMARESGPRRKNRWQLKQEEMYQQAGIETEGSSESKEEEFYVQKMVEVPNGPEHQAEIPEFGLIEDENIKRRAPKLKWSPELVSEECLTGLIEKLEGVLKIPVDEEKTIKMLGENENKAEKVMELVMGDVKGYTKHFTLVKRKLKFGC